MSTKNLSPFNGLNATIPNNFNDLNKQNQQQQQRQRKSSTGSSFSLSLNSSPSPSPQRLINAAATTSNMTNSTKPELSAKDYDAEIEKMNKYLKSLPDYSELDKKIHKEFRKCEDMFDQIESINNAKLSKSSSHQSIMSNFAKNPLTNAASIANIPKMKDDVVMRQPPLLQRSASNASINSVRQLSQHFDQIWSEGPKNNGWNYDKFFRPGQQVQQAPNPLKKNQSLSQLDMRIRQNNVSKDELFKLICNETEENPPAIPPRNLNKSISMSNVPSAVVRSNKSNIPCYMKQLTQPSSPIKLIQQQQQQHQQMLQQPLMKSNSNTNLSIKTSIFAPMYNKKPIQPPLMPPTQTMPQQPAVAQKQHQGISKSSSSSCILNRQQQQQPSVPFFLRKRENTANQFYVSSIPSQPQKVVQQHLPQQPHPQLCKFSSTFHIPPATATPTDVSASNGDGYKLLKTNSAFDLKNDFLAQSINDQNMELSNVIKLSNYSPKMLRKMEKAQQDQLYQQKHPLSSPVQSPKALRKQYPVAKSNSTSQIHQSVLRQNQAVAAQRQQFFTQFNQTQPQAIQPRKSFVQQQQQQQHPKPTQYQHQQPIQPQPQPQPKMFNPQMTKSLSNVHSFMHPNPNNKTGLPMSIGNNDLKVNHVFDPYNIYKQHPPQQRQFQQQQQQQPPPIMSATTNSIQFCNNIKPPSLQQQQNLIKSSLCYENNNCQNDNLIKNSCNLLSKSTSQQFFFEVDFFLYSVCCVMIFAWNEFFTNSKKALLESYEELFQRDF